MDNPPGGPKKPPESPSRTLIETGGSPPETGDSAGVSTTGRLRIEPGLAWVSPLPRGNYGLIPSVIPEQFLYSVTVTVRGGKNAAGNDDTVVDDTIAVTVNVTGVDEPGGASFSRTSAGGPGNRRVDIRRRPQRPQYGSSGSGWRRTAASPSPGRQRGLQTRPGRRGLQAAHVAAGHLHLRRRPRKRQGSICRHRRARCRRVTDVDYPAAPAGRLDAGTRTVFFTLSGVPAEGLGETRWLGSTLAADNCSSPEPTVKVMLASPLVV